MERPSPVELRLLRYFVAAVEEGSITKAAVRLTISQPALSRAIRSLERAIGVELLVRKPQRVDPTPAGRALLESARDLEKRALAAVANARATARTRPRVRIAVSTCDVLIAKDLIESFHLDNPDSPIEYEVIPADSESPAAAVRRGTSDVALLRGPFEAAGTDHQVLNTEPRVVLLPAEHELASRPRLDLTDLRDEPVTKYVWMSATEAEYWAGADRDRHRWQEGPTVSNAAEVLAAVRLGRAVAYLTWGEFVHGGVYSGMVARPVDGLSPSKLTIVWDRESTSLSIAQFVAHAEKLFAEQRSPTPVPVPPRPERRAPGRYQTPADCGQSFRC